MLAGTLDGTGRMLAGTLDDAGWYTGWYAGWCWLVRWMDTGWYAGMMLAGTLG